MTVTTQRFRAFRMPDVGEGLSEAEILRWYVAPGDPVHDGMTVCEVETAKAVVELPIPYDGVVHELHFGEATTVDIGAVIITVDTAPGSEGPAVAGTLPEHSAGPERTAVQEPSAVPAESEAEPRQAVLVGYGVANGSTRRRPRKPPPAAPRTSPVPDASGATAPVAALGVAPVAAKPPVRKLARDLGVDLGGVVPTGPGGVITREDVHAARDGRSAGERRIPVKGVRRATAQAMVASAFTAPHVTEFITVDVTRTMKLVQRLKQDPDFAGLRVTPMLLIAKALLAAIRKYPAVNASWDEARQEIVIKDAVHLGIAAATPRGLIVPNIKNAHLQALPELARSLQDLVDTARAGRTAPSDMSGGTVTISNIGVFGVDTGTPILNPGEAAVLAVGAISERPWVHKGRVRPRRVTTLALSFDHRMVDGELGSQVLAATAAVLERPQRLITRL